MTSALVLYGATGRMGQSVVQALREADGWRLGAAIASVGSAQIGKDAAGSGASIGVPVTSEAGSALDEASVAVDFSVAGAVAAHAAACTRAGVPLLVGATGLDEGTHEALRESARHIAVLIAPNTSVGVGVLTELVAQAARALGPGFDVEILEAHHRAKRDAPSGTALALGAAVAAARGQTLADVADPDRSRNAAARTAGSIGFAVIRAGDIVGEHTVVFAAAGERIEITHRATDRLTFARGALRAARWLIGRPAGLYGMENVVHAPR